MRFARTSIMLSRAGFSLLELLVVIGIFSIFVSMSTSIYTNSRSHTNLELSTGSLVEAIRLAQSSAQSGKGDANWGVKILTDRIIIFKGSDYSGRISSFDEIFNFSGSVSATGLSEIVFEKISGVTTTIGTVVLTSGTEVKNITINERGTIAY